MTNDMTAITQYYTTAEADTQSLQNISRYAIGLNEIGIFSCYVWKENKKSELMLMRRATASV